MKRPIALLTATGLFFGLSVPIATEEQASGKSPEQIPQVETAQAAVMQDIAPRLGAVGLVLVSLRPNDDTPSYTDLLVSSDGMCGSQFMFANLPAEVTGSVNVSFSLFGNLTDLADESKLQGPAMWDGTIGHGDTLAKPTTYQPGQQISIDALLAFIQQNNDLACSPEPTNPEN